MPTTEQIQEWLQLTSNDNEAAFSQLMGAFWNKVYTQAITYLKVQATAQEITQDVFLKIWFTRKELPAIENFSNYLFIISRNKIISELRKKGKGFIDPHNDVPANLLLPDEQLQYKETEQQLLQIIEQLPPTRQIVFKLSRLEGKSYDEIAKELNISRNGVKDHIVKALNFLRNHPLFANRNVVTLLFIWSILYFD